MLALFLESPGPFRPAWAPESDWTAGSPELRLQTDPKLSNSRGAWRFEPSSPKFKSWRPDPNAVPDTRELSMLPD